MATENGNTAVEGNGDAKNELTVGPEGRALSSGFDSLNLSLTISWRHDEFFKYLARLKADGHAQKAPMPGYIEAKAQQRWIFNVELGGSRGYEWLLTSADYAVRILNDMRPNARPSAMVEIRSVALWRDGVVESVDRILELLAGQGAFIDKVMASRSDPCLDMLIPEGIWNPEVSKNIIKRADYLGPHYSGDLFTGFTIGKGSFKARLYDKPVEIATQSHKTWMFDIWGLNEVPPGYRVVRVEFQIQRERLLELGIDTVWNLINNPRNLWAYCTENWLKFQEHAELHHTQQKTMPWWQTVQSHFLGHQRARPLIRAKVVHVQKKQLAQQLMGQLTSLIAMDSDGDITPGGQINLEEHLDKVVDSAELIGMDSFKLHERVRRKLAKHCHDVDKFYAAEHARKAMGFPTIRLEPLEKDSKQKKKGGAAHE